MAIPNTITPNDMTDAIKMIDTGVYVVPSVRRSTRYCLVWAGKQFRHFPPKEIIRLAYDIKHLNNEELWGFSGGEEANNFCRNRGFVIIEDCGGAPH